MRLTTRTLQDEPVEVSNGGWPRVKVKKEKKDSGDDNSEHEFNTAGFNVVKNPTVKEEDTFIK
eukprot:15339469-Ditylum_brightwellii.AAC.1